ncbi:MAG: leucine-rich repeat protein [Oscillospiraceae bacterium]|nr:leucine-rich repeat protein [Oscillospiraceae bacterium]
MERNIQKKKRFGAVVLALIMVLSLIPAATLNASAIRSGDWEYVVDGASARITDYYGNAENVSIPSTLDSFPVTSIGTGVFEGKTIVTVTIPSSITSIGNEAFRDCAGLTSVTIPSSVISIGHSAFRGCAWLTSITIPNSVTSIGEYAFSGCIWLTSVVIPDSVTSLGQYAFSDCTWLESATLSKGLTRIAIGTFQNCTALTSITIPPRVTSIEGGGSYTSQRGAFSGCTSLATVTFMSARPPTSVTNSNTNQNNSFYNCPVTKVNVPTGSRTFYATTDVIGKTGYQIEEIAMEQPGTINVNTGDGGSSAGGGDYYVGENVTVSVELNPGYTFDGWYIGNQRVSINVIYTFVVTNDMVNNGLNLEARFTIERYTITATAGTGGTATGGNTYNHGANVTLTATPGSGNTFDGWYEGEARVSTEAIYSFTATANRILQARFKIPITLSLNTSASVTITSGGRMEVRFTAPSTGAYNFESSNNSSLDPTAYTALTGGNIIDDDGGDGNNYLFQRTLSAGETFTFYSGVYNNNNVNGTYILTVTQAINPPSAPQNFTATPGNRQVMLSWTAPTSNGGGTIIRYQVSNNNGNSWVTASSNTSHTFTGLTNGLSYNFRVRAVNSAGNGASVSRSATPQAPPVTRYTITAIAQTGGIVRGGGIYSSGAAVTLTATAITGYTFNGWYEGNTRVSTSTTYRLFATTGRAFQARFVLTTYTVTFKNGNTNLKNQTNIKYGAVAVAPPNPKRKGFIFTGWDKKFNKITKNLTVNARFERNPASPTKMKATRFKRKAKVSWKKQNGVTVEIQQRIGARGKWTRTGTTKKAGANSFTTKNLRKGRRYQFRARAIKRIAGRVVRSAWTGASNELLIK